MGMGCISHHHWLDSFQQFNTGNYLQRQFSWFPARSSVQKEEVPFSWSEALMAVSSSILLTWFFFFLSWRSWHFVLSFHCSTYHGFYFPGWKLQPGRCCHHLPHAWLHIADENKGHYNNTIGFVSLGDSMISGLIGIGGQLVVHLFWKCYRVQKNLSLMCQQGSKAGEWGISENLWIIDLQGLYKNQLRLLPVSKSCQTTIGSVIFTDVNSLWHC